MLVEFIVNWLSEFFLDSKGKKAHLIFSMVLLPTAVHVQWKKKKKKKKKGCKRAYVAV